jgi:hypothetical protein
VKFHHWTYVFFLFVILLFAFFSHSPSEKSGKIEAEPVVQIESPAVQPTASPALPAPTLYEVNEAITRVFGDCVGVDGQFMSADLNGDGSDDLVVPVKLRPGKLNQVTDNLANWSIQDVLDFDVPPPNAKTFTYPKRNPKPHLSSRDRLLAVIHGYGARGWRNPDARQAYLLVHASANQFSIASIHDLEALGMALPRSSLNPTLALTGNVEDRQRAIYWTGAQYAAADMHTRPSLLAQK